MHMYSIDIVTQSSKCHRSIWFDHTNILMVRINICHRIGVCPYVLKNTHHLSSSQNLTYILINCVISLYTIFIINEIGFLLICSVLCVQVMIHVFCECITFIHDLLLAYLKSSTNQRCPLGPSRIWIIGNWGKLWCQFKVIITFFVYVHLLVVRERRYCPKFSFRVFAYQSNQTKSC